MGEVTPFGERPEITKFHGVDLSTVPPELRDRLAEKERTRIDNQKNGLLPSRQERDARAEEAAPDPKKTLIENYLRKKIEGEGIPSAPHIVYSVQAASDPEKSNHYKATVAGEFHSVLGNREYDVYVNDQGEIESTLSNQSDTKTEFWER